VRVDVKGAYNRLGAPTTTVTTPSTVVAGPGVLAVGATTTTVRRTTTTLPTTTTVEQVAILISINGDSGGATTTQFDPSAARVFVGSLVEWVNHDKVARSVVADNHVFGSAMLAPGATFSYRAVTVGTFNYHDGTRPYAVGSLEVIAR
jgi:plastocyanin